MEGINLRKYSGKLSTRMVITKTATNVVHPKPCIKEALMPNTVTMPRVRPLTRRVAELPSLRYGSIGATSPVCGPLRVQHDPPLPAQTDTGQHRKYQNRSFTTSIIDGAAKSVTRRVRFDLPPPDGVSSESRESSSNQNSSAQNTVSTSRNNSRGQTSVAQTIATVRVTSGETAAIKRVQTGHSIGRYIRGTLSPTSSQASCGAQAPAPPLLRAAQAAEDHQVKEALRRAVLIGISEKELNAQDSSGRTAVSYIASNGSIDLLEIILQLPGLDVNLADNEGNTPLHFAAQAGQVECLNYLLSRCQGLEIDARNNLGFTPLMKAALQGRNKCAKLLLFAGANPTLRDTGRGLRAEQWARYCGRYVCADVIEKLARHRLLERSTSCGRWGSDSDIGTRLLLGKVVPVPNQVPASPPSQGIKSKLRKVFRTSSGPSESSSARLVTQLTSAALCASSPVLPAPQVSPVVKSLIRPLTVPRLQITLANGELNGTMPNILEQENQNPHNKPPRSKKKMK